MNIVSISSLKSPYILDYVFYFPLNSIADHPPSASPESGAAGTKP